VFVIIVVKMIMIGMMLPLMLGEPMHGNMFHLQLLYYVMLLLSLYRNCF
jgi:hypothetical protein